MKLAKWALAITGGLLVLIVLALLTVTLLIDPNRFRGQIEGAVHETTGRPFHINGDLDITWFPWLAVRTGQAELGNAPGISGPPFAQWQSTRVGVRLMPLIHGELVVDRVRFQGLQIHLSRDAEGHANWEGLLAKQGEKKTTRQSAPRIAGLELRDSALDYADASSGRRVSLSSWNLDIDGIRLTDALDRIGLGELETQGQIGGSPFPATGVPFATRLTDLSVIFEPLDIAISQWSLKLAEAELAGSLAAKKSAGSTRASGPLSVRIPSTRKLLAALGIHAPLPRDSQAMGALSLKTSWSLMDGAVALKPLSLKLDETAFEGELARTGNGDPTWTFDLHGDRIDLGRYLITEDTSSEPFELPVEALKALRARGTLVFDQARFADTSLKNARLRILMADGRVQTLPATAAEGPALGGQNP